MNYRTFTINFASDVLMRPLSDDVMHMRKFGYYSMDHTWKGGGGGEQVFWGIPNQCMHSCV